MNRDDLERAKDLQDLDEGRTPTPVLTRAEARDELRRARRIAVVGASADPSRPSHDVMAYLLRQGYDCVPINPTVPDVLDRPAFPDLASAAAAGGPFDIVDVFRRPEATPEIAAEAVAVGARVLWLQLGIVNWEAASIAHEGGLLVVMDHCTKIEHSVLAAEG